MFDPKVVRKDFPIFERRVHGDKPLVYLDSAATSQKPQRVIDQISEFYEHSNANVHRGVYELAEEATVLYEGARAKVAAFIGAQSADEIVFTKSCTEATNLVANTWARANLREGDEIVVSEMEHHSNLIPWLFARDATGAKVVTWPVTDDGELTWPPPFTERTKLVCVTGMSNVLGTINDIARITSAAHDAGTLVLVDAAQLAPHVPVNVVAMGCDFLTLTGHKMCGPTGSGALWARKEILEAMPPFLGGGEMILEVWMDRATYNAVPYKFEAGTPNIAQEIGMGYAIDYLNDIGMDNVHAHEVELVRYALDALASVSGLRVFGPSDPARRGGVVSFWMDDVHPHDLATIIDTEGVCVRAGHHCAQPLMRRYGIPATTRASFYIYNTTEDVDTLVRSLDKARSTMAF